MSFRQSPRRESHVSYFWRQAGLGVLLIPLGAQIFPGNFSSFIDIRGRKRVSFVVVEATKVIVGSGLFVLNKREPPGWSTWFG